MRRLVGDQAVDLKRKSVVQAACYGSADDRHAPDHAVLGRQSDGELVDDHRAVLAVVLGARPLASFRSMGTIFRRGWLTSYGVGSPVVFDAIRPGAQRNRHAKPSASKGKSPMRHQPCFLPPLLVMLFCAVAHRGLFAVVGGSAGAKRSSTNFSPCDITASNPLRSRYSFSAARRWNRRRKEERASLSKSSSRSLFILLAHYVRLS